MNATERYVLPEYPASASNLAIDLYSEHHLDHNVKNQLIASLISTTTFPNNARILILGGRAGLTTEILLPYATQIDLVE